MRLYSLLNILCKSPRLYLTIAGLFGATSILFGAWSSHHMAGQNLTWVEIATRYQSIHALALFALGIWLYIDRSPPSTLYISGISWGLGTIIFSGSLMGMAFTGWTNLGMMTPVGGLLFAFGWLNICYSAAHLKPQTKSKI